MTTRHIVYLIVIGGYIVFIILKGPHDIWPGALCGFREVLPFLILVIVIGVVVETIYHFKGWE